MRRAAQIVEGPYEVGFIEAAEELKRVQRLHSEVFTLELDEGLAESGLSGTDRDAFDIGDADRKLGLVPTPLRTLLSVLWGTRTSADSPT